MLGQSKEVTIHGIPPITIIGKRNLLSVKVFGECVQNGTPTPDNPVDIVCNNGVLKVDNQGNIYADGTVETINVHGKNLFDKNNAQVGKNWNGNSMAYSITSNYIPAKKGDVFTLSISDMPKYTSTTWVVLDSDYTYLGAISNGSTITQDACAYIRLSIRCANTDSWTQSDLDNAKIQVELGSTATDYEPYYNSGTATAETLFGVGNYQDVQSIIDGIITKNVGVCVYDGSQTIGDTFISTTGGKDIGAIIVYPLATPTIEQVAGQTLALTSDTNIIDITQASLQGLELEVKAKKT